MAKSDLTFRVFGKDVTASKTLKGIGREAGKAGGKMSGAFSFLGGPAGIATAAAAGITAVGVALVDASKAAAADQAAARKLEKTLRNVTGATDAQVASVEDYISATAKRVGVEDDQLRPALSRLVRSTKDAQEAQEALAVALDVSSATGKPLEAVAAALGKAYDGNTASLSRLGLGIDASVLKSGDLDKIMGTLRETFGGFADQEANTVEGKVRRIGIGFDELKESIGAKVLPVAEALTTWAVEVGLPALEGLWETIDKKLVPVLTEYLMPAVNAGREALADMGKTVDENRDFFNDLMTVAKPLAAFAGGQMALSLKVVAGLFRAVTAAATAARGVYLKVTGAMGELVAKAKPFTTAFTIAASAIRSAFVGTFAAIRSAWNSTLGGKGFTVPEWVKYLPGGGSFAGQSFRIPYLAEGGIVTRPTLAMIGEAGPEAVVPLSRGGYGGTTVVLNINGPVAGPGAGRWLLNEIESAIKGGGTRPNVLATR